MLNNRIQLNRAIFFIKFSIINYCSETVIQKIRYIKTTAPKLIPNVKPPIPSDKTINIARKTPDEIPIDLAIPPSTPPNHLSFTFLFIIIYF